MSDPILGFVVALPNEWKYFRAAFNKLQRERCQGRTGYRGHFGSLDCVIVLAGAGRENAAAAARSLVEHHSIAALVSLGYAGALSPELARGDIVLSASSMSAANPPVIAVVPRDITQWETALEQSLHLVAEQSHKHRVHVSPLFTADHIVARRQEKQRIYEETGAEIVDMESDSIFKMAREAQIPFLGIRSVTDTAEDDIPALEIIDPFLASTSFWRYPKIFWDIATHPGFIVDLANLNCNAKIAGRNLAHFLMANQSTLGDLLRSCVGTYPGSASSAGRPA